jgi:hypothetical protein
MSMVSRFGFLASLGINKSKSTWHIVFLFASDYVRACFPNSIRLLDYAIGKTERMEYVAFGSQSALAAIDVGKGRNMVNGS